MRKRQDLVAVNPTALTRATCLWRRQHHYQLFAAHTGNESTAFVRAAELELSTTLPSNHGLRNVVVEATIVHLCFVNHKRVTKLSDTGGGTFLAR